MKYVLQFSLLLCLPFFAAFAQEGQARVFGKIINEQGETVPGVSVVIDGGGVVTDVEGNYELIIPEGTPVKINFSSVSYESQQKQVTVYGARELNIILVINENELQEAVIRADRSNAAGVYKIDPKALQNVPTIGNPVATLIKSLPGVSSGNELSSQYSVRGGNFDENLIYVNGFEVYRPFLIRSGQQEGFNFINADLVSSVSFSPGGFEAKYGDKLSSVLDVTYKRPREFAGSGSISLLGGSFHLEGASKDQRLSYVMGYRQKSNSYVLNSLPTQGQYFPLFIDFQAFLTYDLNTNWQLQSISNYSNSRFLFIPDQENIRFGTFSNALNLRIAFEGQEKDTYGTFMNGLGLSYTSDDKKKSYKFLTSHFNTREREAFDIVGEYWIGEVQNNLGENDFGEVTRERGIGTYHTFARNELEAQIFNFAVRGLVEKPKGGHLQWGLKFQREVIEDQVNEWERRDSAGFSLPFNSTEVLLFDVLKSEIDLQSNRYSGFIQDSWSFEGKKGVESGPDVINERKSLLTAGVRLNYWDLNNELIVSPRLQYKFLPERRKLSEAEKEERREAGKDERKGQWSYRLATGLYHQPPFYRELRNNEGVLNTDLRAQKSWHFVLGTDYDFSMWNRPFKFTTELYYKHLWDLVSYDIDNVLIRYSGLNDATGYAAGADFRIYGEFVENVDSWFSVSFLKTEEDIDNDAFYKFFNEEGVEVLPGFVPASEIADSTLFEPGLISRPTNQTVNFSIFFQDYVPNNDKIQVNLNVLFGTPFRFSPPGVPRLRNAFRSTIYFRTDIGFSAQLYDRGSRELPEFSLLNKLENVWASLEVFNLLGVSNTVSNSWINDFTGTVYAVPNRLTSRRINLRVVVKF